MKTVCLGLTSSTVLTTSRKSGFSRNLVSLFVWTFVVMLAVRTVVGGAVWGGPGEKQELEGYILTFDSACRQEVLPGCILGCTSMSRPQLTLTPQGSLLLLCTVGSREWRALEWWDFESLNPALSNIHPSVYCTVSLPGVRDPPRASWDRGWLELILWEGRLSRKLWSANRSSWLITRSLKRYCYYYFTYLWCCWYICVYKCELFNRRSSITWLL